MPGDGMGGQVAQRIGLAARGEDLKRADPQMARRHAGQDRTGQHSLADHVLARGDGSQRTGRRDAERVHGFRHHIFAHDRAKPRPPVATA